MELKGQKITLIPLKKEHIPACWRWINDKKVIRFLSGPFPKTYRGELKWFREIQKKKNERIFAIMDTKEPLKTRPMQGNKVLTNEPYWLYGEKATPKLTQQKTVFQRFLKTKKHIGNIGIHNISKIHKNADIGIIIGEKAYWGKGYGTDAMKTALKYCFNKLKLNKVSLNVFTENLGAQKCYKKCGFKKTGIEKEEFWKNGKFLDVILMEAYAKDFK